MLGRGKREAVSGTWKTLQRERRWHSLVWREEEEQSYQICNANSYLSSNAMHMLVSPVPLFSLERYFLALTIRSKQKPLSRFIKRVQEALGQTVDHAGIRQATRDTVQGRRLALGLALCPFTFDDPHPLLFLLLFHGRDQIAHQPVHGSDDG